MCKNQGDILSTHCVPDPWPWRDLSSYLYLQRNEDGLSILAAVPLVRSQGRAHTGCRREYVVLKHLRLKRKENLKKGTYQWIRLSEYHVRQYPFFSKKYSFIMSISSRSLNQTIKCYLTELNLWKTSSKYTWILVDISQIMHKNCTVIATFPLDLWPW